MLDVEFIKFLLYYLECFPDNKNYDRICFDYFIVYIKNYVGKCTESFFKDYRIISLPFPL